MRILFAADEHPYSAFALKEVITWVRHTWADVTLLGVVPGPARSWEPGAGPPFTLEPPLAQALAS
jgi:nucleotide-binding universal stress UspA family protein